jgi:hypothetical protein
VYKRLALVLGLATLALFVIAQSADARNTPCSGKKGGVSHCRGGKFVCNDGSTSASKKTCSGRQQSSKADTSDDDDAPIGDDIDISID